MTTRLEASWQDENNCVEVFLLTEVASKSPGTTPASNHASRTVKPSQHEDKP